MSSGDQYGQYVARQERNLAECCKGLIGLLSQGQRDTLIQFQFASLPISSGKVICRERRAQRSEVSVAKAAFGGFYIIVNRFAEVLCRAG
jgi:hypothetical protein